MALGDTYITSAELKARLGLTTATDDTRIANAVETASRDVEQYCSRQFNKVASASERKYYALSKKYAEVADFFTTTDLSVTVVEVSVDGVETSTLLDSDEYRPEPLELFRHGYSSEAPHWALRNLGSLDWPCKESEGYLKVTAMWGWNEVPSPVKQATYILAEEYFKLKDAPFGVVNWGEFGPMRVQENKVVRRMLSQYARGRVKLA